jgi:Family of unknown function (DUF7009)
VKLRILDDSIRLRLARSEVDAIARGECVEARTTFPDGARFVYALSTAEAATVSSRFAEGRIDVVLPRDRAVAWALSNEVSIRGTERTHGGALALLIEKDFECLAPREGEDASDRFPNPKAQRRPARDDD